VAYLEAFAIIVGALAFAGFALKLNFGPFSPLQGVKLWVGLLLGAALCLGVGGAAAYYRISRSARPEVEGIVGNLRIYQGNHGTKSTGFDVTTTNGKVVSLNGSYYGGHLRNGQAVDVTYLENYAQVLKIKSLEPEDAGWSSGESDGLIGARLSCWSGVVAAIVAVALLPIANRTPKTSTHRAHKKGGL
jgi:hypothetical protein